MYKYNKVKLISTALLMFITSQFLVSPTLAVTPTAQPSGNQISSDSADLEKIQKIKDIVADKVSKLKLVEKRGIIGTVTDVSNAKITVLDVKNSTRNIDVDELTKFDLGSEETDGISDLKKGTQYSFVGLYNKDTQRLLARSITTTNTIPVYLEGAISSIDEKNFQLEIVNTKGEKKLVDIQSSTKTSLAAADGDLTRSGFSKLNTNERVLAIGFWDKKNPNLLAATRVIHFSDIPPSKEMQSHIETTEPSEDTAEEE